MPNLTSKLRWDALATTALTLLVAACGSSDPGTVTLNLELAPALTSSGLKTARSLGILATQAESRSFTPTSFKLPIFKITIAKEDGTEEQNLYTCEAATEEGCLVDLMDEVALDALAEAASEVSIRAGAYDKLSLYTCEDGSSGSDTTLARITGSGEGPDGNTWTTDADDLVNATGSGTATETDVGNWACATKNVIIKGGITVAAGEALTLSVVVDNTLSAYFNNNTSDGMGGCASASGSGGDGLCVTYPALLPYVGSGGASMKRFSISHDATDGADIDSIDATKANALILVAVDSEGTPLMAYGRTLFTETSETCATNTYSQSLDATGYDVDFGGPTYVTETNFDTFTVNSDGTIAFQQGASEDTFAATFEAFDPTQTHVGTVTSRDDEHSWTYLATLLE